MHSFTGKSKPYVHYITHSKTKAEKEADKERIRRGGNKYLPEIIEVELDSENISTWKEAVCGDWNIKETRDIYK
jgi:hypothetical protein